MCRLLGIRTKPEHTGRSSRHGNSAPGCNAALSRVLKVPNRHLQTPQELHPPLADIRQIEPCAAMMRTPFQHGKRDTRNMIQYARPIQPSWRRRETYQPAAGAIPASSLASYRVDTETCRYSEYHATNKRSDRLPETRLNLLHGDEERLQPFSLPHIEPMKSCASPNESSNI